MSDLTAAAAELVERTCAEQGIAPKITDRVQLGRVAAIVRVARDASASRAFSRGSAA